MGESAMPWWVMLLLTQLPMPLLRSTPTRSPPTPTSMPWLTTTLDPALMLQRLTTAPLPGGDTTLSTCPTEVSSTSTTTLTTLMDTSLRSPTMALLPSPLLLLVSAGMASPTVVSSAMVWWATVSESPTEELPTLVEPSVEDRQRKHTDKTLGNIHPIFIYL